jgi:hypothetical protein
MSLRAILEIDRPVLVAEADIAELAVVVVGAELIMKTRGGVSALSGNGRIERERGIDVYPGNRDHVSAGNRIAQPADLDALVIIPGGTLPADRRRRQGYRHRTVRGGLRALRPGRRLNRRARAGARRRRTGRGIRDARVHSAAGQHNGENDRGHTEPESLRWFHRAPRGGRHPPAASWRGSLVIAWRSRRHTLLEERLISADTFCQGFTSASGGTGRTG